MSADRPPLSRRTVVAGTAAAWSAPAIVTITAAPSFAASGPVSLSLASPVSASFDAYALGTTHPVSVAATVGGAPAPAGTVVVFSLAGTGGASTSWLGLGPADATDPLTQSVLVAADGTATVTLRFLPGQVPTIPTVVSLVATVPSVPGSGSAAWTISYRVATAIGGAAIGFHQPSGSRGGLFHRGGSLWSWGLGASGRLGNGSSSDSDVPVRVDGGSLAGRTVVRATTGGFSGLALDSAGGLHAWGRTTGTTVPSQITSLGSLAGRTAVGVFAALQERLYVIDSDGGLHGWGSNYGLLGDGTQQVRSTPVRIQGSLLGRTVVSVACSQEGGFALTSDGAVHAWGETYKGSLGTGAVNAAATSPVVVGGGSLAGRRIVQIAAGANAGYAVDDAGLVHGWGDAADGQLGTGGSSPRPLPALLGGLADGSLGSRRVVSLAVTGSRCCLVLAEDGTLHTWGASGMRGSGLPQPQRDDVAVAVRMSGAMAGLVPVSIAAAFDTFHVLTTTGRRFSWGITTFGSAGVGPMAAGFLYEPTEMAPLP